MSGQDGTESGLVEPPGGPSRAKRGDHGETRADGFPVQNTFPINPGYVLTDFQVTTGYDLHPINGLGMKYYSDTNPPG